jgi:D-alanyl-lipoteichoic acid acyltransferase DltB (MBOAT superfamily)
LTANLGLMASFKYSSAVFGISLGVMPLGLSFHTFQAIAYTIEVYRGTQPAERSFFVFALYVLFFPQIAAGPIERPKNLIHQFKEPHPFDYANIVSGLQLMAWGFFQKYVVATEIGKMVDSVYGNYAGHSGPVVAFAALCYPFQILCDFSGYSDIAIGAAQVLGFRLTRNFCRPFFADSMSEYWKRWHISLSQWMRDYVFFPLCGRRPGTPRVCAAIIVVFLANGIWHGARWSYVVSGLLHGTYRVTEFLAGRSISRTGWNLDPAWQLPVRIARTLLVFSLMTLAFVFFRSDSLTQAMAILSRLGNGWAALRSPATILGEFASAGDGRLRLLVIVALIFVVQAIQAAQSLGPLRPRLAAQPAWFRWSFYYASIAALLVAASHADSFIYFKF